MPTVDYLLYMFIHRSFICCKMSNLYFWWPYDSTIALYF